MSEFDQSHSGGLVRFRSSALGVGAVLSVVMLLCSCGSMPPSSSSEDPLVRFANLVACERAGGRDGTAGLISALEDPDPALRAFAADGLVRVTGESFDNDFSGDADRRAEMVRRWQDWWDRRYAAAEKTR